MFRRIFANLITPSSGTRFPALDGLRGLAVMGVVIFHFMAASIPYESTAFFILQSLATFSVCIFFSLSAFLLYYPHAVGKKSPVFTYYNRRARRILPAYFVAVAFGILVSACIGKPVLLRTIFERLLFLHAWRQPLEFFVIGPTWSLAAEVYFYLALPLLAYLASRSLWRLSGLLIAASALQIFIPTESAAWLNFPVLALPFIVGMIAAVLVSRYSAFKYASPLGFAGFAAFLALPLWGFRPFFPAPIGINNLLFNPWGIITSTACLLLIFSLAANGSKIFSSPSIRLIGICGYGIFLFHAIFLHIFKTFLHWPYLQILGITVSLIAGTISYLYIELPFIKLASRSPSGSEVPSEAPALQSESELLADHKAPSPVRQYLHIE